MAGVSNIIELDNGGLIGTLLPFRQAKGPTHQLERDRIMRVRDELNDAIDGSGWHFQTDPAQLDLGAPYLKLDPKIFLLRDDWSVDETFDYWKTHPIQIDCLIILNLLLLFYLRDELEEVGVDPELMRPAMKIDVSCGLVQTGVHHLIEAIATPLVPLGELDYQREVIRQLGPGAYLYIRGPHGWYDCVYDRIHRGDLPVDTVYQGENVISIGNSEFLAFSRDYYGTKLKSPQLVIKNFEYILDELRRNGRKQLGPLYSDDSTTYVLSRSNNLSSERNKFDVAGVESLQILGSLARL